MPAWWLIGGAAILVSAMIAAHRARRPLLLLTLECSLYVWLLRRVVPRVRFSLCYPHFTGRQFHAGHAALRAGDILLSRDSRKLSTYLIPGTFPHAAVCVGSRLDGTAAAMPDGRVGEVVEAVAGGVRLVDFFDFCHESDRVVILRVPAWDPEYVAERIVPAALSLLDRPYDLLFRPGPRSVYCSELPLLCDPERRLRPRGHRFPVTGWRYVLADDWLAPPGGRIVWDSDLA